MKLWHWLKAQPWAKAAGVFLAAVLFGLSTASVARQKAKARAKDRASEQNAAAGAGRALERAAKQAQKADVHRQRAENARLAAEIRLDRIGASDDTLAELVSDWNADRVRD